MDYSYLQFTDFIKRLGHWFYEQPFMQVSWGEYKPLVIKAFRSYGYKDNSGISRTMAARVFEEDFDLSRSKVKWHLIDFYAIFSNPPQSQTPTKTVDKDEAMKLATSAAYVSLHVLPKLMGIDKTVVELLAHKALDSVDSTVPGGQPSITLAGRTDLDDFFAQSGVIEAEDLPHHPYLVFHNNTVHIIHNTAEVLEFPDDAGVMVQWPGKHRSDFFQFTVSDLREQTQVFGMTVGGSI